MSSDAIVKKVKGLFSHPQEAWDTLDDASEACDRPLWLESKEEVIAHAKVLPEVFDKDRVMMVLVILNASIHLLESENEEVGASSTKITSNNIIIDRLKKLRTQLDTFNENAKLSFDSDSGRVKLTFTIEDYTPPKGVTNLLTVMRTTGTLPQDDKAICALLSVCCDPIKHWDAQKTAWERKTRNLEEMEEWPADVQRSASRAALCGWLTFLEIRKHQAEMTILSADVLAGSSSEEAKNYVKLMIEPAKCSFTGAKEAENWIEMNEKEIAALKKLVA